jgi:hypothetical protein
MGRPGLVGAFDRWWERIGVGQPTRPGRVPDEKSTYHAPRIPDIGRFATQQIGASRTGRRPTCRELPTMATPVTPDNDIALVADLGNAGRPYRRCRPAHADRVDTGSCSRAKSGLDTRAHTGNARTDQLASSGRDGAVAARERHVGNAR